MSVAAVPRLVAAAWARSWPSISHLVMTWSRRQVTSSSSSGKLVTMRPVSRRNRSRRATSRSSSRSRVSTRGEAASFLLSAWYCTCKQSIKHSNSGSICVMFD